MRRLIIKTATLLVPLSLSILVATPAQSQPFRNLQVPLTINENEKLFVNMGIDLSQKISDTTRLGKAPGGVLVSVERSTDPPDSYRLRVDSNGDGDLTDESPILMLLDSPVKVRVTRRWSSFDNRDLPYLIEYSRIPDRNNNIRERFSWTPHYRAEGKLSVGECQALLVAVDLNGDGLFDNADFLKGTSIGLDRNADGRIWGAGEWLRANQIVEYCDTAFLIDGITANGSRLTLAETSMRVAKVGAAVPDFSLKTTDGATVQLRALKGKIHLLDFWASWCKPCIEKFSLVKQIDAEHEKAVNIIAVNVDDASRLEMAREIVKQYQLRWPQVMAGKGEADPLWKTFGGMETNRLTIPLYVLVDSKGILRYAGNGGENLSELRRTIEDLRKVN